MWHSEEEEDLSAGIIRTRMNYFETPENKEWQHEILGELLDTSIEIDGFLTNEVSEMIHMLCTT